MEQFGGIFQQERRNLHFGRFCLHFELERNFIYRPPKLNLLGNDQDIQCHYCGQVSRWNPPFNEDYIGHQHWKKGGIHIGEHQALRLRQWYFCIDLQWMFEDGIARHENSASNLLQELPIHQHQLRQDVRVQPPHLRNGSFDSRRHDYSTDRRNPHSLPQAPGQLWLHQN